MATLTRPPTTRRRAGVTAAAVLVALAVWIVAGPLLGVDLFVPAAGQPVGAAAVVVTALVAALLGWGLLTLLERRTPRARRIWTAVALVAALLSLAGPLTSGASAATVLTLIVEHLAVAAVLIAGLPGSSR